jgi:hypothetical protein
MKLSDLPQLVTAAADFEKLLNEAKVCEIHDTYKTICKLLLQHMVASRLLLLLMMGVSTEA